MNVNIFKSLLKPFHFRALARPILRNVLAARDSRVPTHRNELLPFTINNLWDNPGSKRNVKKLGRGLGNGKGKTAGRGYKGQRSRAGGGVKPGFEGGQAPFQRRMPKWGRTRTNRERPVLVNLEKIVEFVKKNRLDNTKTITIKDLYDANLFKKTVYGVKILSKGTEKLDFPLNLEVTDASKRAIEIVKAAGGSITCVYRSKLKLRELLKPEKFRFPLEEPIPTVRVVKRMERARERGAEVSYKEPTWVKEAREKLGDEFWKRKHVKLEDGLKKEGDVKIHKRKPFIYRTINLKLK